MSLAKLNNLTRYKLLSLFVGEWVEENNLSLSTQKGKNIP